MAQSEGRRRERQMTRAFTTETKDHTPAHLAEQVDVVIPCYNAETWIARTIRSVQAQGHVVRRIIVVDDGSTDGSLAVLRPLAQADAITLLTGPNRGGCHARNRGLKQAEAPHVMFLDADDEISGPMLTGSVEAALNSGADVVFSAMEQRYPDGTSLRKPPPGQDAREIFETWFDSGWVGTCSVVWRSAFLRKLGGWDETRRVGQDGELVLRALLAGARAARNDKGVGVYHRGVEGSVSMGGGVSRDKLAGLIELISAMTEAARQKGWDDNLGHNHAALYFLARKGFMNGHADLGRRALAVLRAAGHRGHHGSRAHVAMASLIGLERKVRWFG